MPTNFRPSSQRSAASSRTKRREAAAPPSWPRRGSRSRASRRRRAEPKRRPPEHALRLTELDGRPVVLPEGTDDPYIKLDAATRRTEGFTGCNRIMGGYELAGETLSFPGLASSRMYCAATQALEHSFRRRYRHASVPNRRRRAGAARGQRVGREARAHRRAESSVAYRWWQLQAGPVGQSTSDKIHYVNLGTTQLRYGVCPDSSRQGLQRSGTGQAPDLRGQSPTPLSGSKSLLCSSSAKRSVMPAM